MKYPKWFDYEVAEFSTVYYEDINSELVKRDVDAREVISITLLPGNSYTNRYRVFYRKPVKHPKVATPKAIRGTCVGKGIY
jgi:hypothetical protein